MSSLVLIGLVEDIDLTTKRQRITQIVRKGSKELYGIRYGMLYKEFELKFHVNLSDRLKSEKYSKITPKLKNKMDLIDRGMNMIPQLYKICCKLFENDVKTLVKEWESTVNN